MAGPSVDLMSFALEYGNVMRTIERASSGGGLGEAEGRILSVLRSRSSTQAELCRELTMDSGQVSRATNSLRGKNLVEERKNRSGRARLTATAEGSRLAAKLSSIRTRAAGEVLASLTESERQRLLQTVHQLGERLFEDGQYSERHIRPAEPGDTGLLIVRAVESFCGTADWSYDRSFEGYCHGILADLATLPHFMLVAIRGRTVAGAVAASTDVPSRTAKIHFLVMFHGDQGCGIGTTLLGQAVDRVRSLGITKINAELPSSDFGPTFYSKFPSWTRIQVEKRLLCGRPVQWEKWEADLRAGESRCRQL